MQHNFSYKELSVTIHERLFFDVSPLVSLVDYEVLKLDLTMIIKKRNKLWLWVEIVDFMVLILSPINITQRRD